jgi:hypothetical protein
MSDTELLKKSASEVGDQRLIRLLESRHEARLQWCEPWPARGPEDNALDAHIQLSASVHDCINMQRIVWSRRGEDHLCRDADLLADFIAIHWCKIIWPNDQGEARR